MAPKRKREAELEDTTARLSKLHLSSYASPNHVPIATSSNMASKRRCEAEAKKTIVRPFELDSPDCTPIDHRPTATSSIMVPKRKREAELEETILRLPQKAILSIREAATQEDVNVDTAEEIFRALKATLSDFQPIKKNLAGTRENAIDLEAGSTREDAIDIEAISQSPPGPLPVLHKSPDAPPTGSPQRQLSIVQTARTDPKNDRKPDVRDGGHVTDDLLRALSME